MGWAAQMSAWGWMCGSSRQSFALWIARVEWGALVLCYGLWAYTQRSGEHTSAFCVMALFSLATDALALAGDGAAYGVLAPVATSVLLLSKLLSTSMLVYYKDAFA